MARATTRLKTKCLKCGVKFTPRRMTSKWCSKACWSTRVHELRQCKNCKTDIKNPNVFCSIECRNASYVGKKASKETREKMSKAKQGYMPVNVFKPGALHPHWKVDRREVDRRWWPENKIWRLTVLKRDNYTCQMCGIRSAKSNRIVFDVDHIKPWSQFPELRFEVSNGRTLCRPCHKKTPSFLNRWQKFTGREAVREDGVRFVDLAS